MRGDKRIHTKGVMLPYQKQYTRTGLYHQVAKAWVHLHMCDMLYASTIDVHIIYIRTLLNDVCMN